MVELLVVLAVIALMGAIAISYLSGILSKTRETTAQRNAQTVAYISSAAIAAGATNLGATVEEVVATLSVGVTTTNGTNVFGPFVCKGLPPTNSVPDKENYRTYLVPTNGGVSFVP